MPRPLLAKALAADWDVVSVLFIEDDPHLAEMYRLKLEMDGYRVMIAGSEEEIRGFRPDLIYLDIRAPHRDRVELLRRLRHDGATRWIPVIILSDYREQDLFHAGADLSPAVYFVRSAGNVSLSPQIGEWASHLAERH
jgi:DNA-binding response OmpR family regulator